MIGLGLCGDNAEPSTTMGLKHCIDTPVRLCGDYKALLQRRAQRGVLYDISREKIC